MRSAFVYFQRADEAEVVGGLRASTDQRSRQENPWLVRTPDGDPVLYVDVDREKAVLRELEPADLRQLIERLGGEPSSIVQIDLSGRHVGRTETMQLAIALLERSTGLAGDDCDGRLWSVDELRADAALEGRRFLEVR